MALGTKTTCRASPQERFLCSLQTHSFPGKHQIFGIPGMCFLFVHTNAPDRSDVPASSVLYCCVLGRQAVHEILEDALGAPASSYEALLLSAGKCRQSPSKSWIRQLALAWSPHTPEQRHCMKTDNLVQSLSKHRCQLRAHIKGCWCKSAPPACLSSLTSQPFPPHLGASFLHDALLHLQPLPCQLINNLISQQPPGQTAEQLQMRGTSLRSVRG